MRRRDFVTALTAASAADIQHNIHWIAHFHTGGVPTPCRDPIESLNQALGITDV
jgi:hypothetical protein